MEVSHSIASDASTNCDPWSNYIGAGIGTYGRHVDGARLVVRRGYDHLSNVVTFQRVRIDFACFIRSDEIHFAGINEIKQNRPLKVVVNSILQPTRLPISSSKP